MDFTFGGDVFKVAEKWVYPKLSENDLAGLFAAQKGVCLSSYTMSCNAYRFCVVCLYYHYLVC